MAVQFKPKGRIPLGSHGIPKGTMCVECGEYEATVPFSEGDVLHASHFGLLPLCERCYSERCAVYLEETAKHRARGLRREGQLAVTARALLRRMEGEPSSGSSEAQALRKALESKREARE